jgi:hypothetical protein
MNRRAFVALLLSASVFVLPILGLADDPPSEIPNQRTYSLRTSVIGATGGLSGSGSFQQYGTLAQSTPVGNATESDLALYAGFWKGWRGPATAIDEESPVLADQLDQNYPNPFNPVTTIRYAVAKQSPVELAIYNVRGQKVRRLVSETKSPGRYTVNWDGTSDQGTRVASGVYFYRIQIGSFSAVKKMVVLK